MFFLERNLRFPASLVLLLLATGATGACSSDSAPSFDSSAGTSGSIAGSVPSVGDGGALAAGGAALAGAVSAAGETAIGGQAGSAGESATGGTTNAGGGVGASTGMGGASGGSRGLGTAGRGGAPGLGGSGAGGVGAGGVGAGGRDSTSETIHYYGRWDRQANRAVTVNSGSYVTAQFTGTGISARFDVSVNDPGDLPTVAWRIDQSNTWQVAEVKSSLPLGAGLGSGSHAVTLIARGLDENKSRWTPPLVSSISFLGFDTTGGTLQATPSPSRPKLEILGDSITEGVVVQGGSFQGKTGQCWKNDAVYSYPTQAGLMLSADYRQVGFGFQGLLKGGDGGVPDANGSFPFIYKNKPRDNWQADWVVINQGTNDSSQSAANFTKAYTTFVATIRAGYPNAKIVALRPFSGAQQDQIKAVVAARNAAGDGRVYYVDTTGWLTPGSDFTDSLHPNVQGSAKAAGKLATELRRLGFP